MRANSSVALLLRHKSKQTSTKRVSNSRQGLNGRKKVENPCLNQTLNKACLAVHGQSVMVTPFIDKTAVPYIAMEPSLFHKLW